jgi:hypothetical protein
MSYRENRVTVAEYGTIAATSPLLVPVPTAPGYAPQKAHVVLAGRLVRMSLACEHDTGIKLLVASGRRPPLWPTRRSYERDMIAQYGSVKEGRKWRAFASAHQTGLAVDFKCGGVEPSRTTIEQQLKTPLFLWLKENAWRFGFTPYLPEPWHWELRIPLLDYYSGRDLGEHRGEGFLNVGRSDDHPCEEP